MRQLRTTDLLAVVARRNQIQRQSHSGVGGAVGNAVADWAEHPADAIEVAGDIGAEADRGIIGVADDVKPVRGVVSEFQVGHERHANIDVAIDAEKSWAEVGMGSSR